MKRKLWHMGEFTDTEISICAALLELSKNTDMENNHAYILKGLVDRYISGEHKDIRRVVVFEILRILERKEQTATFYDPCLPAVALKIESEMYFNTLGDVSLYSDLNLLDSQVERFILRFSKFANVEDCEMLITRQRQLSIRQRVIPEITIVYLNNEFITREVTMTFSSYGNFIANKARIYYIRSLSVKFDIIKEKMRYGWDTIQFSHLVRCDNKLVGGINALLKMLGIHFEAKATNSTYHTGDISLYRSIINISNVWLGAKKRELISKLLGHAPSYNDNTISIRDIYHYGPAGHISIFTLFAPDDIFGAGLFYMICDLCHLGSFAANYNNSDTKLINGGTVKLEEGSTYFSTLIESHTFAEYKASIEIMLNMNKKDVFNIDYFKRCQCMSRLLHNFDNILSCAEKIQYCGDLRMPLSSIDLMHI